MKGTHTTSPTISDFTSQYEHHLLRVRGLARSTRNLHRYVVHRLFASRFPAGQITWSDLRFSDFVEFLTKEFARLSSRDTQRAWLMILRSVLRYLAEKGHISEGWDAALPKITSRRHAHLPRRLSQEQVQDLFVACQGEKPRHLRYRALLLLFLRLGLRTEEVANLSLTDIDWKNGYLQIRCTKTYRDRILPLPQDVGEALVVHLRTQRQHPTRVFEPRRPPFTAERSYYHVRNSMRYLFGLAAIVDRGTHSLRHTAASEMINGGASFKEVADVLGHKSVTTTLIYAKLDLKSLKLVALPWPGGVQ
jgi:site-specific recombinase XerD